MAFDDLVRTMRGRMPWDTARRIFEEVEIERGHGWEATVRKLSEQDEPDGDQVGRLSTAVQSHVLCGEKSTRFYRVSTAAMRNLRQAAQAVELTNNRFRRAYPAQISDDEIAGHLTRRPVLAAVHTDDDGIGIVLASTRAIQVRTHIDVNDLAEDAAAVFDEYDEVIGISNIKHQAMDVVWIPHSGNYVEVRVDYPKGTHLDTLSAAHEATKDTFTELVSDDQLTRVVNLFPLIQKIYDDPNEGNVVELAFGTTTASLKHEKMRRKRSCLRTELYHRGGVNALRSPIEPFRLSVRWEVQLGSTISNPELSLNGSSRTMLSGNPTIHEMTVRGCVGAADYEHVRDRVEHFLNIP